MRVKLPSGATLDLGTRDDVAKAIGEKEAAMAVANEDAKHLRKVLRTFERLEAGAVDDDKPATVPLEKKATG